MWSIDKQIQLVECYIRICMCLLMSSVVERERGGGAGRVHPKGGSTHPVDKNNLVRDRVISCKSRHVYCAIRVSIASD